MRTVRASVAYGDRLVEVVAQPLGVTISDNHPERPLTLGASWELGNTLLDAVRTVTEPSQALPKEDA